MDDPFEAARGRLAGKNADPFEAARERLTATPAAAPSPRSGPSKTASDFLANEGTVGGAALGYAMGAQTHTATRGG